MLSDLSLSHSPSFEGQKKTRQLQSRREGGQVKRLRVFFQPGGGAGPLPIVALCCVLVVAGIEGVKNRRRREWGGWVGALLCLR